MVKDDAPNDPVTIKRVECFAFREKLARPLVLSFGVMRHRSAVFVRIEDEVGAFGWGEIFANWPAAGAEHRCRLLAEDMADLLVGQSFARPNELIERLDSATRIRALQCGEWGPFRQVIAGLDIAVWDLCARRAGLPLARYIRKDAPMRVAGYASGIHIDEADTMIGQARAWGFTRFKVKVGFDLQADPQKVCATADGLLPSEQLMCDANQAWDVFAAKEFLVKTANARLGWVEEPVIATSPPQIWRALSRVSTTPIAAGENIAGLDQFDATLRIGAVSIYQPDVAKWGGVSGCLAVAAQIRAAGKTYCPHFLGGGIGLTASAHVLAAAGGDGVLEVDVNPNVLRDGFVRVADTVDAGHWSLSDAPGLGIDRLPEEISQFQSFRVSCDDAGVHHGEWRYQ